YHLEGFFKDGLSAIGRKQKVFAFHILRASSQKGLVTAIRKQRHTKRLRTRYTNFERHTLLADNLSIPFQSGRNSLSLFKTWHFRGHRISCNGKYADKNTGFHSGSILPRRIAESTGGCGARSAEQSFGDSIG